MKPRSAATLVEVLVAIFVTAIGLLALLALFPLGALTMAQAIKDDRTAHAAGNAAAVGESLPQWSTANGFSAAGARADPLIYDPTVRLVGGIPSNDTFVWPYLVLTEAATGPGVAPALPGPILPVAHADFPGYAVYVDPIGVQGYSAIPLASAWVGGNSGAGGIPRRSISLISSQDINKPPLTPQLRAQLTLQWFTLLDDINFVRDTDPLAAPYVGTPLTQQQFVAGQPFARDGRFSWAFMLRRPRSIDRNVVDMSVVVYSQRPVALNTGLGQPTGESAYVTPTPAQLGLGTAYAGYYPVLATGKRGVNVVTIGWTAIQEKPAVRRGSWILDASIEFVAQGAGSLASNGWSHGYFYRVVGITEPGILGPGSMDLELQTPLREDVYTLPTTNGETYGGTVGRSRTGQIIVMENVAEVFEKGPGWLP
jgi:hypothetical protein